MYASSLLYGWDWHRGGIFLKNITCTPPPKKETSPQQNHGSHAFKKKVRAVLLPRLRGEVLLDRRRRWCSAPQPSLAAKRTGNVCELGVGKRTQSFVIGRVPLVKLSRCSMMAANTPVCNLAFRKLFGVSETLVSACKETSRARASSCADRYENHTRSPLLLSLLFRKNLNASKPSNYQSKGLGGNIGCRDKNSTWY